MFKSNLTNIKVSLESSLINEKVENPYYEKMN